MDQLQVINVLGKETYEDCHITGSITVPLNELGHYAKKLDKKTPIVVYCASYHCPASSKAWLILDKMGFVNVKAYEGGMAEWTQKKYPSTGACNEAYLKKEYLPEERDVKIVTAEELMQLMKDAGLTK